MAAEFERGGGGQLSQVQKQAPGVFQELFHNVAKLGDGHSVDDAVIRAEANLQVWDVETPPLVTPLPHPSPAVPLWLFH